MPGCKAVYTQPKIITARDKKERKLTFAVLRAFIIARKTKMSSAAAAVEKRGIYAIASELNKACSDL